MSSAHRHTTGKDQVSNDDHRSHDHLLSTALAWQAAGYTPVPTKTDGSKHPPRPMGQIQHHPATPDDVRRDFAGTTDGIGLVTGDASSQLEMLEVEGRALHLTTELATLMADNGFGDLWARVNNGYVEASPSGGIHWHYRVDGPARPNTKLASRPATPDELAANPGEKIKVLIETRGKGGFTVIAPSSGRTHPTGKAWVVLTGSMASIPTLTVDERDALYAIAGILDQLPVIDAPASRAATPRGPGDQVRPGDDYNTRAAWADILGPLGWTMTKRFTPTCYGWTRPGKNPRDGISATTGRNDGDNLYVFSSSTQFTCETPYSKFGAYTPARARRRLQKRS